MRRITPDMPRELAQRIYCEEMGDVQARLILNDCADRAYALGLKAESATLIHACEYLKDRAEYAAMPWPKGMVQVPAGAWRFEVERARAGRV